jgi:predicted dehydrogenase
MKQVRLGVVGLGGMGTGHAHNILQGKVSRCVLSAVVDGNANRLAPFKDAEHFASVEELIASGTVDAILIATPHYSHPTIGLAAMKVGVHVLTEKPLAVHKADCERFIAGHKNKKLVFAEMFNMRTDPHYIKIRELVRGGDLGQVWRINWIITNWFRSDAYYASGGWRATWGGEGGGVLLNQCPHQIDIFQWIFGMPQRVRAFCHLGKYHNIEVEDDVTAYFEYDSGATAVFIASTGEAPGTNRLEITAENGRLVYENNTITVARNAVPMSEFRRTTKEMFAAPAVTTATLPIDGHGPQHIGIIQNFVDAILDGAPLVAPAKEGIHSVELANAMLYSSLINKTVPLPLDGAAYERKLKSLVKNSRFIKPAVKPASPTTVAKSFNT